MPRTMYVSDCMLHMTMEYAVPSVLEIPNRERANMTARFQGPRPPFEGTAIEQEPKTNTTRPGRKPQAIPGCSMRWRVNGNARKQQYVSMK